MSDFKSKKTKLGNMTKPNTWIFSLNGLRWMTTSLRYEPITP